MLYCAHLNVRSLLNNFDIFKDHINTTNYDVIGISESWLSPNISSQTVGLDNYRFVRVDRLGRGGGVGVYIKGNIPFTVMLRESRDIVEHIWIKFKFQNKTIIIGNLYRSPSSNINDFFSYFEDVLIDFFAQCDKLLCLGDFNINMLDLDAPHAIQLNNILATFGLDQIISMPTRISSISSTLIDLAWCNPESVLDSGVRDVSVSDHFLIYISLTLEHIEPNVTQYVYRALKNINLVDFQLDLEGAPWHNIFLLNNIDTKVAFLTNTILSIFDIHAPVQVKKGVIRPYTPWMTDNIKFMKRLKNQALNRFHQTRNPDHWRYYKQLRNLITSSIRNEKKAYLNHKFQNSSPKEQWNELKKLKIVNKKKNFIPDNLKNANQINAFFSQITSNQAAPSNDLLNFYSNNLLLVDKQFKFTIVSEETISKLLLNIKSKAFGADSLNITLIIFCCPFIIPYITHILNCCIQESYFPKDWKLANVVPLPKINNPSELGHLRSISILPTLSKLLEKVMQLQILSYVTTNNIIPFKQSGFRAGYSCTTALTDVIDDIVRAQDENEATLLIMIDYTKAFDMINHQLLLSILKYIGFGEAAFSLVSSFLTDRYQRVICDGNCSDILLVTAGVPQGSILGPLLYSIYTFNFINSLKHCKYHLYADDTQIYKSFSPNQVETVNTLLNSDLESLLKTSIDHSLQVNPSKSVAMLFCSENIRGQLMQLITPKLGNNYICFKNSYKNLGLIVDIKLKFKEHITLCMGRAFSMLKLIYTHRHSLSQNTKSLLCESLILSHFNFADSVYSPFLDSYDVKRIQKIQNCCIRLIFGIRRRQPVSHKLRELRWLSMFQRRILHSACFFYKIIKFKSPPYLHQKLSYRTDVHNINIRRQHLLTVPAHKKESFKNCFTYQTASLINKYKINDFSYTITSFKKQFKNRFLRI